MAVNFFFFLIALLFGFPVAAAAARPQRSNAVTAMYLLGDSSVDCGGLNTLFYPLLHRNFSLLPCQPNRTSLLIPHLLADKIGIPHSQPMYAQNGSIEAILNGLSFGSPQATIMSSNSGQSYQSLNQQLRQVLDTIQLLRLRLGQGTARRFIESSLFYLSFGQVDFINLYLTNSTTTKGGGGEEFARVLVSQMLLAIRNLEEAGARKIVCMGIPPLGCSPRVLAQERDSSAAMHDETGCVKEVNELVVKYNEVMGKEMVKLKAEFGDGEMVFCDVYKGMMEMIGKPSRYGFEESKSACCGVGWYNASIAGCLAMELACSKAGKYVWWDFYNPTAAVNSFIADSAWRDQPFSNFCHPSTIQQLITT